MQIAGVAACCGNLSDGDNAELRYCCITMFSEMHCASTKPYPAFICKIEGEKDRNPRGITTL